MPASSFAQRCEVFAPASRKSLAGLCLPSSFAQRCEVSLGILQTLSIKRLPLSFIPEYISVANQGLVAKCGRNEIDFATIL
jgi:hypothetical protein